jgi:glycosyltransferase, family 2
MNISSPSPSISIITVSYNAVKTIEDTILSVLNQTYPNIEYIIIDGGSIDGTLNIIKKYQDRISYWITEPDKGIYDAMNKGIQKATGDYLFFLGADDVLMENVIQRIFGDFSLLKFLIIYGNVIYDNNNIIKSKFSYKTFLHNTIHHQAAFYSKKLFNFFRYDTSFKIASDYELNLLVFLTEKDNTIYKDIIVSNCKDNGVSRQNALLAQKEMNGIRRKYLNTFQSILFDIIANLKFKLHQVLK